METRSGIRRGRSTIGLLGLCVMLSTAGGVEGDMPGLAAAPPGFGALPFAIPTGEAIGCVPLAPLFRSTSAEALRSSIGEGTAALAGLGGDLTAASVDAADVVAVSDESVETCRVKGCRGRILLRRTFDATVIADLDVGPGAVVATAAAGTAPDGGFTVLVEISGLSRAGAPLVVRRTITRFVTGSGLLTTHERIETSGERTMPCGD